MNVLSKLLSTFALLVVTSITIAQTPSKVLNSAQRDKQIASDLSLPTIDATAWALLEVSSGWVVAGENIRQPLAPASITKLMMNYILFEQLKQGKIALSEQVPISVAAWRAEGSRMFADVDTKIELGHLLKSTVIQSGNDAAIALAEHIGGSEAGFASLMNQTAVQLGLSDSHFVNSTGLPAAGHKMSASDIAALSAALILEFPEYYEWYSQKEYTHNGITQQNRNRLLWKDESVDGLKTGFTEEAGFCLVGTAQRNGQRWVAVVLGADSQQARETAVLQLLNYAFAAYTPATMLDAQGGIVSAPVYGGEVDEVRLQVRAQASIVVPQGRLQDVQTELRYSPYFEAPIEVGQAMGVASLSLDGKSLIDVPLLSMSAIKPGSWWKRMSDSIKLRWKLLVSE